MSKNHKNHYIVKHNQPRGLQGNLSITATPITVRRITFSNKHNRNKT
jgi:hypothetical protein